MDPLGKTGLVLVRFANLYWLVTVSGFQGSGCSGFPAYPAVLPAARHRTRVGGKEIYYALTPTVSTGSSNLFRPTCGRVWLGSRAMKTPPGTTGRRQSGATPPCAGSRRYGFVFRSLPVFNTRSGLSTTSGGAGAYSTSARRTPQGVGDVPDPLARTRANRTLRWERPGMLPDGPRC